MYQEVLDRCVIEFGMDANSIRKLVDKGHPDVMRVWNKMASEKLQNLMPEITSGKQQVSGHHAEKALNDFSVQHDQAINKSPEMKVKEAATSSGINVNHEGFTASIKSKEEKLKGGYQKVTSKNTEQYHNIKQANELQQRDLQAQVNKYEEDRIGQGWFSKRTADTLNAVTFGKAGETIGGPSKGSPKANQINKGAYQNAKRVEQKDE